MELKIEKNKGDFQRTNYRLSINSQISITKDNYKTIIDAIEAISEIIDPLIEEENKKQK